MIDRIRQWSLLAAMAAMAVLAASADSVPAAADAGSADVSGGKVVFDRECAVCHGPSGKGDGPAADLCDPVPRNFADGFYKLRTTESGELPTDADLTRTVTEGIPGTAMPSFRHLGTQAIADVIAYVKTLGGPENGEGSWFELYEIPPPISVPPEPPVTADSRALGDKLYVDMGCDGCHGSTGAGDGKKPTEMLDDSGNPLHVRSFRLGVYKGGARGQDIYARIMTGMDGTPMTGFWKDAMTPAERWAVTRHVLSYGRPQAVEQPSRSTVQVKAGDPPTSAGDADWKTAPATRVLRMPLRGGWARYFAPLEVRAVAGEEKLALSVSWDDGDTGCQVLRAIFAPSGDPAPTFYLGSPTAPVRVWQWHEEAGTAAFEWRGPDSKQPVETELDATLSRAGSRRTVALVGATPPQASELLLMVSSCGGGERHATASTFYGLGPTAADLPGRSEP